MKSKRVIKRLSIMAAGFALALLFVSPVFILVNSSFKSLQDIYINVLALPKQLSFQNYTKAFKEMDYVKAFMNSFAITCISTALIVRYKTRTSKILFLMFAAVQLIPLQCVMLPLVDIMSKLHLMNRPGLVFMYMGFGCAMSIILFHGFIKNIPIELEEAAIIDGCNMVQTFINIVLPLLKGIIATVAVINVMWIWNDFLLPSLVINKNGMQTLPLRTYLFFGQFTKKWNLATASLMLCMIPIVLFYLSCQKYIVKGITAGVGK